MAHVMRRLELKSSPTRCPYCHDDISSAPESVVCQECLARHHRDCWEEACANCSSSRRLVSEHTQQAASELRQPAASWTQRARGPWILAIAALVPAVVLDFDRAVALSLLSVPIVALVNARWTNRIEWSFFLPPAFSIAMVLANARSVQGQVLEYVVGALIVGLMAGLVLSVLSLVLDIAKTIRKKLPRYEIPDPVAER